jgi:hypothetical protein
MKRHWIEYGENWIASPMSYWVHIEADGSVWGQAGRFDPPKPRPVAGRGYPLFYVEVEDFLFHFASLDELRVCIGTLSERVLPSTLRATKERGEGAIGPNGHWLSRLPARLLGWPRRQRVVKYLEICLLDFVKKITPIR